MANVRIAIVGALFLPFCLTAQTKEEMQKLIDSAKAKRDKSNGVEAARILQGVISESEKLGYQYEIVEASLMMGTIYNQMGDRTAAYEYSIKALKIAEQEHFDKETGLALMNLGTMYEDESNSTHAIKVYERAKNIFQAQNDLANLNQVEIRLGNVLLDLKKPHEASIKYKKALSIAQKMNNKRQIANIYNNLGLAYIDLNKGDSALYFSKEAKRRYLELGITNRYPASLHNIGRCYYKLNKFDEAIAYADSCYRIGKENVNIMIQRDALLLLRDIYQAKQAYQKAFEYSLLFSEIDKKIFDEEKLKKIQQIYALYEIEKKNNQISLLELKKQEQQIITYFLGVVVALIACIFIIFYQKVRKDKRSLLVEKELQETQSRLERTQKEKAEEKFLRMQVSPHFLFNTLNNLFSLALKNNDQVTAGGINKLSNLTRYLLYQSKQDIVSLENEVFLIENYIGLQKLRINNHDDVEIIFVQDIEDPEEYYIAPNILITFVENAFKYGILPKKKSQIFIKMLLLNDAMYFVTRNTKHNIVHPSKEASMGIGLDNAKKQLQILYPDKHQLEIEDEIDFFQVQLQIQLEYKSEKITSYSN